MTRRDTVAWAKEEVLAAIDEKIAAIAGDAGAVDGIECTVEAVD